MLLVPLTFAEDWSRFHGPNGSGVSNDTNFPTEFSKEKNILWRTPVRAGKSSPILTRRHIFLTSFDNGKLITGCYDRETGKLLWERSEVGRQRELANLLNHPAAITPVPMVRTFIRFSRISAWSRMTLRAKCDGRPPWARFQTSWD